MPHSDTAIASLAQMTREARYQGKERAMTEQATMTNEELSLLMDYMADSAHYTKQDMAYAVEKPWKYTAELAAAKHEQEKEGHLVSFDSDHRNGQCMDCDWTVKQ